VDAGIEARGLAGVNRRQFGFPRLFVLAEFTRQALFRPGLPLFACLAVLASRLSQLAVRAIGLTSKVHVLFELAEAFGLSLSCVDDGFGLGNSGAMLPDDRCDLVESVALGLL